VRPLAPSRVDACNPLLQAHPTWARDKHEGHGISTSHARLPPAAFPPFALRLAPTHLGWGTRRQFTRRPRDPPVSKRRQKVTTYCLSPPTNTSVKYGEVVECIIKSITKTCRIIIHLFFKRNYVKYN
jgi:hypothetical protein